MPAWVYTQHHDTSPVWPGGELRRTGGFRVCEASVDSGIDVLRTENHKCPLNPEPSPKP